MYDYLLLIKMYDYQKKIKKATYIWGRMILVSFILCIRVFDYVLFMLGVNMSICYYFGYFYNKVQKWYALQR